MPDTPIVSARQGVMAELDQALARGNWTAAEVEKLSDKNTLAKVRRVLHGHAEIVTPEHVFDLDAAPFVPEGWEVEEHCAGGVLVWDTEAQKDALYLDKAQRNPKGINGTKLREKLRGRALNANVLDALLAHPHLIPEEWKGKFIYFWGTIYRDPEGHLYVRCLVGGIGRWNSGFEWIGRDWIDHLSPAALFAA